MLVDFSTEPKVAAFFASHNPPDDGEDLSCIVCLDPAELTSVCEMVTIARPGMTIPRAISVDIPELWRLQAQRGFFLDFQYDESFERHIFEFTRIVFPTERDPIALAKLIPKTDIYPKQKSDLEQLLDQFVMLETMRHGNAELEAWALEKNIPIVRAKAPADGIEAACFGSDGLPTHESWLEACQSGWVVPMEEKWMPHSAAPTISLDYPSGGDSPTKIQMMAEQVLASLTSDANLRRGPVRWVVRGLLGEQGSMVSVRAGAGARIIGAMELVWNGLRRWPYSLSELSRALAFTLEYGVKVALRPDSYSDSRIAEELAKECLGDAFRVAIEIEAGGHTLGYAHPRHLADAVREDLSSYLQDPWKSQVSSIRHILQVASNPRRAFRFDHLKTVFATEIVPTQVVLRDDFTGRSRRRDGDREGDDACRALLHNPARAIRVGLP
jgi:hypothetical protein